MTMKTFVLFSFLLCIVNVFANNPTVKITATDPPVNPIDGVIVQQRGKDVQMTCVVDYKPADAQVQWTVSNKARNISNVQIASATKTEDAFRWSIDRPSATSWRLRIQNAQANDEGEYICKIEVVSHNNVLDRKTVRVVDTPQIKDLDTSTDQTKDVGEPAMLECYATGRPAPTITWTRMAGELLPNGGSVSQGNRLSIRSVKSNDAGYYKCTASNFAGSDERLILFTVKFKPEVSTASNLVYQKVGYVKQLVCNVKGYPQPTAEQIYWKKSGGLVTFDSRVTIRNIIGAYNRITSIINFNGVESSDFGTYECSAVNDKGTGNTVRIDLQSSSQPTQDRSHRIVSGGMSVMLINIALTFFMVMVTCLCQRF